MKLTFDVELSVDTRWDKDAEAFVCYCPEMDIYSQVKNESEAVEAVKGAVEARFKFRRESNEKVRANRFQAGRHPVSPLE